MIQTICFCFLITLTTINGHQNKIQGTADLETALMPQELNPAFFPSKDTFLAGWAPIYLYKHRVLTMTQHKKHQDAPWQVVMPLPRTRRSNNAEVAVVPEADSTITTHVKNYSRVVACVVLALSAIIEIVVYVIESYQAGSAAGP